MTATDITPEQRAALLPLLTPAMRAELTARIQLRELAEAEGHRPGFPKPPPPPKVSHRMLNRQAVLALITERPGISWAEIRDTIGGMTDVQTTDAVSVLRNGGAIRDIARGRYVAATYQPEGDDA